MTQEIKQTEQLYLVEQTVTRVALIQASDLQKVEEVADALDPDQWVKKLSPYSIREVQRIPFLHVWMRREQPHLRVQYVTASRNTMAISVGPCVGVTSPTLHEVYLPYDLVREYGLSDAFLLWERVDSQRILRIDNQYYTRDGSLYQKSGGEVLLSPEELVQSD